MDSFFSLFDPSDEVQSKPKKQSHKPEQSLDTLDTVKKKPDQPKGRRRNRRGHNKNETLPEESSFLCEPNLTTELLVKGESYIEAFIAPPVRNDDNADKKFRRRNSVRKNRRKKCKTSPAKELLIDDSIEGGNGEMPLEWNNVSCSFNNKVDESVGKNVNDLNKFEVNKKFKRKDEWRSFQEQEVCDVIEKLEKVSLKDDIYMAGDFNTEDLESDLFYSSDDLDESPDDSLSDLDESTDEAYGSLPPEPRFGNVEYKLQLVNPCEKRLQHLVTQLKWRLRSGGGSAVYVVGVRDCGALVGLRPRALRASLYTLRRMAAALRATLTHVTARRVAPTRAVAEVCFRKLADTQQSVELRVAVMGANEAGKSTLIGVLTQGELDNGRGSARLNMFRHLHEVRSGRTSSLSHEILGFDAQGNVVNYGCSELMTAERIGERSAKLVSFLDLAGHRKYQKTTVHGLTGYSPHYAMLVVSATAGINRMTEEHIGLLLALDLPFFIAVTKLDLAQNNLEPLLARLKEILSAANCKKCPLLITDEHMARNCVAPQKLILDALDDNGNQAVLSGDEKWSTVGVFPVSCVRGGGLNALHAYLLTLEPPVSTVVPLAEDEACEFQIDEIFHVGESSGPVVGGLLARGFLHEGDNLLIGPMDSGEFEEIRVKSIYRNRVPYGLVKAGQSASLGLCRCPRTLRQGMVLIAIPEGYKLNNYKRPTFGGCTGNCSKVPGLIKSAWSDGLLGNKKRGRRKQVNLISDVVQSCLAKDMGLQVDNMYRNQEDAVKDEKSSSDSEKEVCSCDEEILLEDPNDPRGCIFFQATVRVLRHSTAIYPGFQATVHVGNVRQTAVIEGIMSRNNLLRAGESSSVVFRFVRQPEYLRSGRQMLFRAGLETRGIGRITQVFPYTPSR